MNIRKNPFLAYINDFEAEAENFLRKYKCEDAITDPQLIPIEKIALRYMSLGIINTECLSPDGSVQGAITFAKGIVDVYDWNSGEYVGLGVPGPTVFIDAEIINEGRIRNTLAHECFHWYKHRNYFNYKRTHENGVEFGIRCDKKLLQRDGEQSQWTAIERMEWQARTIAPKILMPRIATKEKVRQLLFDIKLEGGWKNREEIAKVLVERLANFFNVSRQAAVLRLKELGYQGIELYYSKAVLPEVNRQKKYYSKATRHRQPISKIEAFNLYLENEFLRATIDTGAFCYADGYFTLKTDKYVICGDDGTLTLTEYAKANLHECTLDISCKLVCEQHQGHDAATHTMFRSDTVFKEKATFDSNPQNTELYNKAKEFERQFARSKKNHKSASQMLKDLMKDAHWNSSTFQLKTELDAMTYTRVQNDYDRFTFRPLVNMGYCLGLDVTEMEEVLHAAGLAFNPTDEESQAYKFLFTAFPNRDIAEANEFLAAKGFHLLGSQPRK